MQCRECGFESGGQALFCPSCGARLVSADPATSGLPGGVESPASFLGSDTTQARPTDPPTSRTPALVAASGSETPIPGRFQAPTGPAGAPSVPTTSNGPTPQPPAARAAGPRPGDVLDGRWRLEKFLGQGSLCNAYLCRDLAHGNREVVLKAMHSRKSADPALAESFLFLAESVAKYENRGIAKVYESGRIGSTPFYAMEWVSGTPLRLWLMERLTFENRVLPGLRLIRSLLDIFETIHERGCYGCLKPENIFMTLNGPVVTDFGVVGFLTPQEFEYNAYARRYLPYMAPELRQDWSNLIPHSDYYSLGAILYEILAGRAPSSPLRLPSELSDLFGIEADEIILKAMAPKPLDRFGTLDAFRAAVDALQAALLAVPGASQPMNEGGRTLRVESDLTMVPEPEAGLATPPASAPVAAPEAQPVLSDAMKGHAWSREQGFDSVPGEVPAAPGQPAEAVPSGPEAGRVQDGADSTDSADPVEDEGGRIRSVFAALGEGGAAPAQHGPVHAPGGFSERASGAVVSPEASAPAQAGAWQGVATPGAGAEEEIAEEPIPAWLWISIALAGCCMVVLSAYFGLLLQR